MRWSSCNLWLLEDDWENSGDALCHSHCNQLYMLTGSEAENKSNWIVGVLLQTIDYTLPDRCAARSPSCWRNYGCVGRGNRSYWSCTHADMTVKCLWSWLDSLNEKRSSTRRLLLIFNCNDFRTLLHLSRWHVFLLMSWVVVLSH